MRKATISDVARQARVSKTTVSRVLNGRPDVDDETLARVRAVVSDLGYVQSARAVQLAKGRSNTVGLLAPPDTSPWMVEVIRGALKEVQATDFSLTLHAFPETAKAVHRFRAQMRSGLMDALLVVSLQQPLEIIAAARREGLPVVLLNDYGFNDGGPAVVPDEATGIAAAVRHLAEVGRTRFAVIAGTPDYPVSESRVAAYRAALRTRDLDLDERLIVEAPFTAPTAQAATRELIARHVLFDALFASSDAMAVGAMRALREVGLRIPEDISVVGFDDFPSAEYTEPRLTTVHNPLNEMSARAVRRLVQAIEGKRPLEAQPDVVKTHLIVRDSSDPSLTRRNKEETR